MKRKVVFIPACLIAFIWAGASTKASLQAFPPQTARQTTQHDAGADVSAERALLDKYCVTCHSQRLKTGGLALDTADLTNIPAQSEIWEKVIRKLRAEMMPPVGATRPDKAELDGLATLLETSLDKWAATRPNPGRATLHRLNRPLRSPTPLCSPSMPSISHNISRRIPRPMGLTILRILWVRPRR